VRQETYTENARSVGQTHIIMIDVSVLKEKVKDFNLDYERFCMIRDIIIFNGNQVEYNCIGCEKKGHLLDQCFKIYSRNEGLIIQKFISSAKQERKKQPKMRKFS
jgi:hypothetical protein